MVFLTEILASPAPWLPASEHPPAADPKATRTQRRLSQGRSPSEGQRAPRGDARDPPRRPTLPSPDPKRGAYLSGPPPSRRITPPPSSALTSPGGDDPEMLEGGDASRGGGKSVRHRYRSVPKQSPHHRAQRCSDCGVWAISPLIKPRWRRAGGRCGFTGLVVPPPGREPPPPVPPSLPPSMRASGEGGGWNRVPSPGGSIP